MSVHVSFVTGLRNESYLDRQETENVRVDLRRIDNHSHTLLAMKDLGAIDPERLRVVDGNCKHHTVDTAIRVQEATVNCI